MATATAPKISSQRSQRRRGCGSSGVSGVSGVIVSGGAVGFSVSRAVAGTALFSCLTSSLTGGSEIIAWASVLKTCVQCLAAKTAKLDSRCKNRAKRLRSRKDWPSRAAITKEHLNSGQQVRDVDDRLWTAERR